MNLIVAASLLAPNVGLIFWITLTFLLLLVLLRRFAWKPILSALKEREQTIDDSIQRAEKALAEARQIQADNEKARREAEQQAQRILKEARETADKLRTDEIERTNTQVQNLREAAQAEIERMREELRTELRGEITGIAIAAAEKILRENLDPARQSKIVDRVINDMAKN